MPKAEVTLQKAAAPSRSAASMRPPPPCSRVVKALGSENLNRLNLVLVSAGWRGSLLACIKMARSTMRGRQATGGISQCVLSPLYVVALAALVRTAPPISRVEVGTRWVQVFVAPTGVMPKDSGAPAAPAAPATGSVAFGGITSILVSAGFLPVCSTGNNGERMVAVTSNNIRVTGSHWGEPFVHRLRGGMPQGIEDRWRPREVAEKRTRRQARVER